MSEQDDATWMSWPKPTRWGELAQLADGRWRTTWQIELESLDTTQLKEVATAAADPKAGFAVEFTPQGQADLVATVDTTRWGMEVDYYGLTYQLFKLIDSRLGHIRLIQGSPREWRPPFMSG